MHNRKTYFLDLQTLLTYLRDQSCELTTTVRISGQMASGSITLHLGKIIHCQLVLPNGQQISGEGAYKQLQTGTEWQVQLTEPEAEKTTRVSSTSSTPPRQTTPQAWHRYPLRQKRSLDPAFLQSLPHKDRLILRSVYSMIDGKRSAIDIKAQLPLAAEDIDQALVGLRMLDLIE